MTRQPDHQTENHAGPQTTHTLPIGYLIELMGVRAALRLCETFGGLDRLYIPKRAALEPAHPLARAIGITAARKLAGAHGTESYEIPMAKSWQRAPVLKKLQRSMLSNREAARQLGLSTRRIRQIMRDTPDPRQADLFSDKD